MEKKFLALQNKNSDADFQNNEKFVQFKQQLKELKNQCKSACFALVWLFEIRELIWKKISADLKMFAYLLGFDPLSKLLFIVVTILYFV